jgi:hypothetical protein
MSAHQNGRIPLNELTITSIGVRLRADAAASVERMAPRFRREVGHALLASDGYRAMDGRWGQIWTFEDRYTSLVSIGVADRRGPWTRSSHQSLGARWWYRRPNAAAAAVPGTSNHGWATACDFAAGINSTGTKAHRWMNEHGPEYGWIWPKWAQRHPTYEPWHREYDPTRDQHRGAGGGSAVAAPPTLNDLPTSIKEALMAGPIRMKKGDAIRLVDVSVGTDIPMPNAEYDGVLIEVIPIPLKETNQRQWDIIRDICSRVRDQRNTEIAAKVGKR